jgi:hypothetical protein
MSATDHYAGLQAEMDRLAAAHQAQRQTSKRGKR